LSSSATSIKKIEEIEPEPEIERKSPKNLGSAEAIAIALDNGQGSPVLASRGADMI